MSLDAILEELQLTHKEKSRITKPAHKSESVGEATLDQLDEQALSKYERFLGIASGELDASVISETIRRALSTDGVLSDVYSKRIRLSVGDDSDFENDKSKADFAFACDLLDDGFEYAKVEIIMRATRYREKFDEMRGPTTYLERTLNEAINRVADGNTQPKLEQPSLSLDRGKLCIPTTPPEPRDYVWNGRMVAGHGYALGGFGGVSKSQAALQLAASVALGAKFGNEDTKKGCAILLFGEDDLAMRLTVQRPY